MPTLLTVSRTLPRDVQDRQVYVKLDGQHLATLLFGRTITRAISPGEHVLTADNTLRTVKLRFNLAEGEAAHFETLSVPGRGYNLLVGFFGAAFANVEIERVGPALADGEGSTALS